VWETFKRTQRRTTGDMAVTFGKNGIIGLNSVIVRTLKVNGKHAHMLFDRDKKLVGIRIVSQKTPDTYPLKSDSRDSHASISGTSFLKTYNIYPDVTISFPATYDEASKTIVFDVSDLVSIRTSGNEAKKREKLGNK
jgi:hypothetical protein